MPTSPLAIQPSALPEALKPVVFAPYQLPHSISYAIYCSVPFAEPGQKSKRLSLWNRIGSLFTGHAEREAKSSDKVDKEERRIAEGLRIILTRFCPSSRCLGFQHDPHDRVNKHIVLLPAWNWKEAKQKFLKAGWKEENILLMPVPESDHWGYWNNVHLFLSDNDGKANAGKTMASEEFTHFLFIHGVITKEESPWQFRNFTDDTPAGLKRGFHLYPLPSLAVETVALNRDRIETVRKALGDENSRYIYESVLFGKPEERFSNYFKNIPSNLQYFEYIDLNPGDCIINCGVETGNELPIFSSQMNGNGQIYCIDPAGFDSLSLYVRSFYNRFQDMMIEQRYVVCDRSTGACPQPLYGDFSNCTPIAIDDLAERNHLKRVDLIKMDLEGMEPQALAGAAKTIHTFRPQLAIGVYHRVEDFWNIPLQIMELCPDYDFYFNIYSPTHFEGILYAIPKERARSGSGLGMRTYL